MSILCPVSILRRFCDCFVARSKTEEWDPNHRYRDRERNMTKGDPRASRPSHWRAARPPRITSSQGYVADLIRLAPLLASTGLSTIKDTKISVEQAAYNAVNTPRLTDAVVRVLVNFAQLEGIDPNLCRTLITNLTREGTSVGYAAQFQGYDWLIREGAIFLPEIAYPRTLRGTPITLDGRLDGRHGGAFFDIKSYAFEPELRAAFKRRLESRLPVATVSIDGPGNHGPDEIMEHAFGLLDNHVQALSRGEIVRINALGWTIRAHPNHRRRVITSEAEYNPAAIADAHRLMPLWFSSQFTQDAPYILIFDIPYGFGGNPFEIDVFGSTVQVFDGIAAHVFGPARTDRSSARDYDAKMPIGITVGDAVACLSGLALLSEPGEGHPTTTRIHLNGRANHAITPTQARTISKSWTVVPHA
jgi:hypothetical protein